MAKLSVIEGIGGSYEQKLNEAGINSIENYLNNALQKKAGPSSQKSRE